MFNEPQGTFDCPYCGRATPHKHTAEEVAALKRILRNHDIACDEWEKSATRVKELESQLQAMRTALEGLIGQAAQMCEVHGIVSDSMAEAITAGEAALKEHQP